MIMGWDGNEAGREGTFSGVSDFAFAMYFGDAGESKINKPWSRQGGGHLIVRHYVGGGSLKNH